MASFKYDTDKIARVEILDYRQLRALPTRALAEYITRVNAATMAWARHGEYLERLYMAIELAAIVLAER